MRRVLYVGDPHVVPDELDDCQALLGLVKEVAKQEIVDAVCFLGDQGHTHAVLRLEVVAFWKRMLVDLVGKLGYEVILLVGNHDCPGNGDSEINGMMVYDSFCTVVTRARVIGEVLYVGYHEDPARFAEVCRANPVRVVVCHQAFDGTQYESGEVVRSTVDPSVIPQETVLTGHIHSPQRVGKVHCLGAPRWRTRADANRKRAIWVVDHGDDGEVLGMRAHDTGEVCQQVISAVDTPDAPAGLPPDSRHVWYVDVTGPAAWAAARAEELRGLGARVRTVVTDSARVEVRESEGLKPALRRYVDRFSPSRGTPIERVRGLVQERLGV